MSSFTPTDTESAAGSAANTVTEKASTSSDPDVGLPSTLPSELCANKAQQETTAQLANMGTSDDTEVARLILEYDKQDITSDINSYELDIDDEYFPDLTFIDPDEEEGPGQAEHSFNPEDPFNLGDLSNAGVTLDQHRRLIRRQELYIGGGCLPTIVEEEKEELEAWEARGRRC